MSQGDAGRQEDVNRLDQEASLIPVRVDRQGVTGDEKEN